MHADKDRAAQLAEDKDKLRRQLNELRERKARSQAPSSTPSQAASLIDLAGQRHARPVTPVQSNPSETQPEAQERSKDAPARVPRSSKLAISEMRTLLDLLPYAVDMYSKDVQTDPETREEFDELLGISINTSRANVEDQLSPFSVASRLSPRHQEQAAFLLPELSEADKVAAMASKDFGSFLDSTSVLMERILAQPFLDNLVDSVIETAVSAALKKKNFHIDATWCKGKPVMAVSCSPKRAEFFLTAHRASKSSPQPSSCVLVWSHYILDKSIKQYHCDADISTAMYHPTQNELIVGGTVNGQVVLWDCRVGSYPVSCSLTSTDTHSHPIFAAKVVQTHSSSMIITVSTDGRMCTWGLDKLQQPRDTMELHFNCKAATERIEEPLSPYTCDCPVYNSSQFSVGCDDGSVYTGQFQMKGAVDKHEGHADMVTSLSYHSCLPPVGTPETLMLQDIMLTSGADGSVKLWNSKRVSDPPVKFDVGKEQVTDAQWSPVHPAVFAACDAAGAVHLFNINANSMNSPVCSEVLNEKAPMHKLAWVCDGSMVVVGDVNGGVHTLDVASAHRHAVADDWQVLAGRMQAFLPRKPI